MDGKTMTLKTYSEINYELGRIQGLVEGFDTECVIADNVMTSVEYISKIIDSLMGIEE